MTGGVQRTVSPVDGSVVVERALATAVDADAVLDRATAAQRSWRRVPLAERVGVVARLVPWMVVRADDIGRELSLQMGRPVAHSPYEIARGFAERATWLTGAAAAALADSEVEPTEGVRRFIRHDPIGVVLVVAPWNYPYLCSVNAVVPALLAGNEDPAYVRADAPLEATVAGLVDGVYFNAGQSCCGVERIYAHRDRFDEFVEAFVAQARGYVLGDPLDAGTTLGPLVRTTAATFVRDQIDEAVARGAHALIDPGSFPADQAGTPYLAPQVLVDVDHAMRVMTEESFGPVVGIMPVDGDDRAVELMNDSAYGLTASIWTTDVDAALAVGDRVDTGTWYLNRCDYVDPALAWTGVKGSGRGVTLSTLGFRAVTCPKSFHLKLAL
jgi:acyl-CoA reductase-like NAD-dependent aldehyde dehydrogenase